VWYWIYVGIYVSACGCAGVGSDVYGCAAIVVVVAVVIISVVVGVVCICTDAVVHAGIAVARCCIVVGVVADGMQRRYGNTNELWR